MKKWMKFGHLTSFCNMHVIFVKSKFGLPISWNKLQQKVLAITAKIFAVY